MSISIGGTVYNACKKWGSSYWCATEVRADGYREWGKYGYCDKENCPLEDDCPGLVRGAATGGSQKDIGSFNLEECMRECKVNCV